MNRLILPTIAVVLMLALVAASTPATGPATTQTIAGQSTVATTGSTTGPTTGSTTKLTTASKTASTSRPATTSTTGPATQPVSETEQRLLKQWEALGKPEPLCSKALLDFTTHPDATVAFLKVHLKPLKLDEAELDALLNDLGSDDEKVWKAAFEKMQYLDPRLGRSMDELLENATDQPLRNRLIEVLVGANPDELKGTTVMRRKYSNDNTYFYAMTFLPNGGRTSRGFFAYAKVTELDTENGACSKNQWQRADRAVLLLQHIGTPAAVEILKDMATGNPDAQPTKIAKLALKSLDAGE
jgi:hypothetical protein